jgi:hypothetical protein
MVCVLICFPPKPPTGQFGRALKLSSKKTSNFFFKVFAFVASLEKLTQLTFENSRVTSFRDIANSPHSFAK